MSSVEVPEVGIKSFSGTQNCANITIECCNIVTDSQTPNKNRSQTKILSGAEKGGTKGRSLSGSLSVLKSMSIPCTGCLLLHGCK